MRSGQVRKSLRSCRDDNKELATDTGEVSRMSGDVRKSPIVKSRVRELQMFVVVDRSAWIIFRCVNVASERTHSATSIIVVVVVAGRVHSACVLGASRSKR
jgi:hypothetical protein